MGGCCQPLARWTCNIQVYMVKSDTVAYPGGFSGCPETPPPGHDLETPPETNSGYATEIDL